MGTIKITDERIITVKDGVIETWEPIEGISTMFIVYNSKKWGLVKTEII